MPLPKVLGDLLNLPTAPFAETAVMEYVRRTCDRLQGVTCRADRWGNLLVRYRRTPPARPPVTFTAHMDHPGFVAQRMRDRRTLLAAFRGWVEPEYFVGTRVRFWTGGGWVLGEVEKVTKAAKVYRMIGRTARPEQVAVRIESPVSEGSPGMWDLPDAVLDGDLVRARGCDDIAGCAAMLALLERLSRKRAKAEAYCLFTRAEEVGFVGAIGAARARTIAKGSPVVAIETSKALINARIGDGPILRVGDKSSVFSPDVTAFCDRVAGDLARRKKSFAYQRKLMDGGTCESTAYYVYGYPTTGVCVALGNYHNMDVETRTIASEYVSLRDWQRMVDWFEAIALDKPGYGRQSQLRKTIDERFEKYRPLL